MNRLVQAALAAAALILISAVPAGAQSPSAAASTQHEAVIVTGTISCGAEDASGAIPCYHMASDPRVAGMAMARFALESFVTADGQEVGTFVILEDTMTKPEGTWRGRAFGFQGPTVGPVIEVFAGSGAYEGWTYIISSDANSAPVTFTGLLYRGAPPAGFPIPPLPAASPAP
jgi:hypothetical protein